MRFRVFSQSAAPDLPLDGLAGHAGGSFRVDAIDPRQASPLPSARVTITAPSAPSGGAGESVELLARLASDRDVDEARAAALRGKASGMDRLAERCPTLIEAEFSDDAPEEMVFGFCAALAVVTLGPILPPDGATLLGVRSARVRAGSR
jgi:hypothetical protein